MDIHSTYEENNTTPPGQDILSRLIYATLRQEIVLGIVAVLADLFGLLETRHARSNDAIDEVGDAVVALEAQKIQGFPVDVMQVAVHLVVEAMLGLPVPEAGLAVVFPQQRLVGDVAEAGERREQRRRGSARARDSEGYGGSTRRAERRTRA